MKRIIPIILVAVAFVACDNPKSIRHLFRAGNRLSHVEKDKPAIKKVNYLISFEETKDSTENTVFNAFYILPKDTQLFFLNLSYNMPDKLGFEGVLDTCTVNAFFFKSVTDTASCNYALKKTFAFKKTDNFYDIKVYHP